MNNENFIVTNHLVNDITMNALEGMSETAQNEPLDWILDDSVLSTLNYLLQYYIKN